MVGCRRAILKMVTLKHERWPVDERSGVISRLPRRGEVDVGPRRQHELQLKNATEC
jgi:hypothetical protein